MAYKTGTAKAGMWVIAGKFITRIIDFLLLLILARLLTPADFGLLALAMAPVFIVEAVLEIPLAQAILSHPNINQKTYDTAFTLSVIRGLLLAILLAVISIPMAHIYDDPRLISLISALALAPALRGSVSPKLADYMKRMDFRPDFYMSLLGKIGAFIIATIIAFQTKSYWAIASATIISPILMNILSYVIAPYRPHFSLGDWKHFSDILGWNSLSQLMTAINWQTDRLLLGRSLSTYDLGRYTMAQEFSLLPHQIITRPLSRPIMAALTNIENPDQLAPTIRDYTTNLFMIIAPIVCGLALLAQPLVLLTLGQEWSISGDYLTGLALGYLFFIPMMPLSPIALSQNKTVYIAMRSFIEFITRIPFLIFGIYFYGIWGAIIAIAAARFITLIASFFFIRRLSGLAIWELLKPLLRVLVALLIMSIIILVLEPESWLALSTPKMFLFMMASAFLGGLSYITTVYSVWFLSGRPEGLEKTTLNFLKTLKN